MDTLSHALWGYASLRWRGPRSARWGILTGMAPDLIFGVVAAAGRVAEHGWAGLKPVGMGRDPHIWLADGPPMPPDLVEAYDKYYVWSHTLVPVLVLALVWYLVRRRPPWLLVPWALHIVMDIPAHERYLTPFLYPLSNWTVQGYAWGRWPMLLANWGGLVITYIMLYARYWSRYRRERVEPWPEEQTGIA
jgi:hypothetical protein